MFRQAKEKKGVLICGAYGLGNSGDEAILEAVLSQIRDADSTVPVTVISRDPRRTADLHKVRAVWSFNVFGLIRAFRRSGLFLSGGGSLIQDVTSRRSLLYYLATIRLAKRFGCSVVMYGCGIGPVEKSSDRKLAAKVINKCADCITLRDSRAQKELEALGVSGKDVRISGDPALSL
ncbi:MAG: polysaccharide pyruvyl transferase family protein, partial [Firmicutes bacterium]|nr:polysaccharide pyruvyl transferase family protein [Bacillota bacterium]